MLCYRQIKKEGRISFMWNQIKLEFVLDFAWIADAVIIVGLTALMKKKRMNRKEFFWLENKVDTEGDK